jgi:formylglycine-generating enzyme required for sulfatase activity
MDAPPLNRERPEVPVELAALVAKMMAKNPDDRFQTPGEVAKALTPFFKKGSAAFKSPNLEFSQVGTSTAGRPAPGAVATPARTATDVVKPVVHPGKAAEPSMPQARWESLIEFKETERSEEPEPAVTEPRRERPRWFWPAVAGASGFAALLFGIVIVITTKNGRTTIETDGKTPLTIEAEGTRVTVTPKDGRESDRGTAPGRVADGPAGTLVGKPPVPPAASDGQAGNPLAGEPPVPPAAVPLGTVTNTLGMALKLIPAGEFQMGSPDTEKGAADDERPRHRVRITRPFYMGATEVTRGQFRQFIEASHYQTESEKDGQGSGWDERQENFVRSPNFTWRRPGFAQTDEHPVVLVSWNDAVAFCEWLSRAEDKPYRLPTEAEWEYACRAGTTTRYSSGDDPESLAAVGNVADGAARAKFPPWRATIGATDGFVFTAPVGRLLPNAFGLYDMHGNVWEWCQDGYDPLYYQRAPVKDPPGPPQASARVFRGGGWVDHPGFFRSAEREGHPPGFRIAHAGFRVALTAGGAGGLPTGSAESPARAPEDKSK